MLTLYPSYDHAPLSHISTRTLESYHFEHLSLAPPTSPLHYYFPASTGHLLSFSFLPLPEYSNPPDLRLYQVDPAGLPIVSPEISWQGKYMTGISTLNPYVPHSYESIGIPDNPTGKTSIYSRYAASHTPTLTRNQVLSPMVNFHFHRKKPQCITVFFPCQKTLSLMGERVPSCTCSSPTLALRQTPIVLKSQVFN